MLDTRLMAMVTAWAADAGAKLILAAMIRAPLFAEPCGDRPAEMRDVLGVIYISKRAAVASIRGMPAAAALRREKNLITAKG